MVYCYDMSREAINRLATQVLGLAIEVHKELGPGLLESSYEKALSYELSKAQIPFEVQVRLPIAYKGVKLESEYIIDIWVNRSIILELKSVETLLPVHEAQLLTYLKLSQTPVGYLINFNTELLKQGIKRRVI